MIGAIVHFEIRATDVERAKRFYSEVFGWNTTPIDDESYMVRGGRATYDYEAAPDPIGLDGVLVKRTTGAPQPDQPINAFICNIEVEDIDAAIAEVQAAGGALIREKIEHEGIGEEAFCQDTEGNVFSLWRDGSQKSITAPK